MSIEFARATLLGLGTMGLSMGTRLMQRGFVVSGYDIDNRAEQSFAEHGGTIGYTNPSAAAADADIIFCSLPNSNEVERALAGPYGAFVGAKPGTYVVDTSTISPNMSQALGTMAAAKGLFFADAPVSGSSGHAEAGALTIVVGADERVFRAIEMPLGILGINVIHVGPIGSGESIMLLNSLLSAINMAAVAEAHSLAGKAGIDLVTLHKVISTSTGDSWMLRNRFPSRGIGPDGPVDHNFGPGLATRLMAEDLDLVREYATEVGSAAPLAASVRAMFADVIANGWGDLDVSALSKLYDLIGP